MSAPMYERAQLEALKKALLAERAAQERAERIVVLTDAEVLELREHIATLQEMGQRAYAEGLR